MVDLAREAFNAANYELAAEVLEREIAEEGLTQERALGRADALAMQGNFHAAFEAYHLAFKMGKVAHERLNHLVTALVRVFSAKTGVKVQAEGDDKAADFLRDVVMCAVCQGLLFEPVTIPCGHTFCKRCIEKDPTKTCPRCRVRFTEAEYPDCQVLKPTVILCNIFDKWWPDEVKAIRLKWEGNDLFSKKDFSKATEKYTQALNLVPGDAILHSNRSHAYSSNHEWSLALKDALLVCQLRPDWPKGHYRKGMALIGLGRHEEAMSCFLQCLTLDPDVRPAQAELERLLHNLLSPTSELPPLHLGNKLSAPLPQHTPTPSLIHSLAAASLNEASTEESPMVTDEIGGSSLERRGAEEAGPSREGNVHMRCVHECPEDERMEEEEESNSDSELEMGRGKGRRKTNSFGDGRLKACASEPVLMEQGCEMGGRKRANSESLPTSSPSKSLGAKEQGKLKEPSPDLLDSEDFECSLCMRLFYNPVTTPCGHSFCRDCLLRCLDHNNKCPLCKFCLKKYLAERRDKVTDTIDNIIKHFLGKDHVKRQAVQEEEVAELARLSEQMPIFVCTVAYPTVPCPLHIFEPRYRLMLRRCLETGTRQFGMCIYSPDGGYMEHGTVLEIRDVSFMPDGRSVVDTVGKSRFKVLERGMRDGYNVAKVEPMEDLRVEGEEKAALEQLNSAVYQEAISWVQSLPANTIDRILQHFGNMPDLEADPQANPDGPAWTWWLLAILPVDQRIQYTILVMNSLKDRLEALRRILSCIRGRQ
ncbi:LONRF1 [Branchiostoma lanceolatum]|uniref:LONRF1 protein n=1 Tax=Branchiostoma lanceolatum TaxID=7740 RepID=A0A8K0A5X5_BRALA|nr:LONRF1 [Branchiostoma lanceolatum]